MERIGYFYIAYGKKRFFKQAELSARSLRKYDKEAHITLLADRPWDSDVFDRITVDDLVGDELVHDRCYESKMYNLHRSPYEKTFLVDSDTYFLDSCRGLFELLDWYNICLTSANTYLPIMGPTKLGRVEGLVPYNSGIMLYDDSPPTKALFQATKLLYQTKRGTYRTHRMDIYLTLAATMSMTLRAYTLPNIFNVRIGSKQCLHGPARILHYAGKETCGEAFLEYIGTMLNQTDKPRYWDSEKLHV